MFQPGDHVSDHVDDFLHDVLEPADARYVEEHCTSCPRCQQALVEARQRLELLQALPLREVSEQQVQTILEGVAAYERRRQRLKRGFAWSALLVTAASVAILLPLHLYYANLAPSPYDLVLLGQNRLFPASAGAMCIRLVNRQTGLALANVPVSLELRSRDSGQTKHLGRFQTDAQGIVQPRFQVPDWPDGSYELHVSAQPDGQTEPMPPQTVYLKRSWKLMLSSDKPVYQPGQTIHLRALALRRPDLKPVAAREAVFAITDPKGNVIFKKQGLTSKHGITSTDCLLAAEVIEGAYTIACKLGDTESKLTVEVKKYVLPKFKIDVQALEPYYQPGQTVRGQIKAEYFFGGPVANGTVDLEVHSASSLGGAQVRLPRLQLRTDAAGQAAFQFPLPKTLIGREQDNGDARILLHVKVRDTAGQEEQRVVSRIVTSQVLRLEVIPEGGLLVPGVPNTIYLFASYPEGRPAKAQITINQAHEVVTNELGVASFEQRPKQRSTGWVTLVLQARDDQGHTLRREVRLPAGQAGDDFLVRPDKAVYQSGETMKLTALGGGPGTVFVDLLKDGQTLLSDAIAMQEGRGELQIDVPPDLFGTVELCAYRFGAEGLPVRKTRVLYIQPSQQLQIQTKLDKDEYRPGQQAKLSFTLSDRSGKPVAGALSLAAVDEAVFSVLSQAPGMERTFYLLEQELLKPVYAIYPWMPGQLPPEQGEELEQALFARTVSSSQHSLAISSFAIKEQETRTKRQERLDQVILGWGLAGTMLVLIGYLALWCCARWLHVLLFHLVAGPVLGCFGMAQLFGSLGLKDAPAVFRVLELREEVPKLDSKEEGEEGGIRVREHFPETLLWRPELITDDQGRASLDLTLADSITTWRLTASAVTADGQLGGAQTPIRVFQPFFVDLNLPVTLTRGDEVSVPVVVYNYLDQLQTVELTLTEAPWFDRIDPAVKSIELGPKEVRSTSYRLKVLKVGHHPLQVTARGSDLADAIKRSVEVVPDGQKVEHVVTDRLRGQVVQTVTIPEHAIPDSSKIIVKLYPGVFSQVVEGIDGLLRQPFG